MQARVKLEAVEACPLTGDRLNEQEEEAPMIGDTYLHADDGVDKEEHRNEQTDVGQRLERLNKRPK